MHCRLCHRGAASCRRTRADTNGSCVCLAPDLHGRARVPRLRIEMSHGCLGNGFRPTAARCDGGALCRMRVVRTRVYDSERSRGHSSHASKIAGAVAFMTHKNSFGVHGKTQKMSRGSRGGKIFRNPGLDYSLGSGKFVLDNVWAYTYHTQALCQRFDLKGPEGSCGQQGRPWSRVS